MKRFPFKKLDAFATENSGGNPAGYLLLDNLNEISPENMLQIAKELKGFVSEVGYVSRSADGEFNFKYYSSERELDFCGHVTIAAMYDLLSTAGTGQSSCFIHTNRGRLKVDNRIATEGAVFVMAPEPVVNKWVPDSSDIAMKLEIKESEISREFPVTIVNAGLETLIVPITSLDTILSIQPVLEELKEFCIRSGIDIIEVFTPEVYEPGNQYRTRVFAPTFGYIEDPATGSGNSAFGYYLISNNLWKEGTINIEQNGNREHYNSVKLQQQPDENINRRVWFGGGAVTRIEGEYLLHFD